MFSNMRIHMERDEIRKKIFKMSFISNTISKL